MTLDYRKYTHVNTRLHLRFAIYIQNLDADMGLICTYLGVGELDEISIEGVFHSVRGKSEEGNQRIVESCIAYVSRIRRPPVCHVTLQYIL